MYQVSYLKKKKLPSKRGTIYTLIVKVLSEIYQQVRSKNQSREKKSCIYVELPTWIIYLLIKSIWTHHKQRLEYDSNSIKL